MKGIQFVYQLLIFSLFLSVFVSRIFCSILLVLLHHRLLLTGAFLSKREQKKKKEKRDAVCVLEIEKHATLRWQSRGGGGGDCKYVCMYVCVCAWAIACAAKLV